MSMASRHNEADIPELISRRSLMARAGGGAGLLGLAALVTRQEVLLIIVGGVFVIETLSVIAQVGCFKLTGQRIIACSPLHNHFLFKGQHEIKIVTRFWIGSALLALVAVASLKIH